MHNPTGASWLSKRRQKQGSLEHCQFGGEGDGVASEPTNECSWPQRAPATNRHPFDAVILALSLGMRIRWFQLHSFRGLSYSQSKFQLHAKNPAVNDMVGNQWRRGRTRKKGNTCHCLNSVEPVEAER
ncbi:uncharacterized protein HMPREF1120_07949 [Exophiala dermatitidis NIH/UT8656]|uniref:Uncharacterized protein n=1 Tax=Exophiala dermatitidis (strain ATCC 34100 / CBS 525.76 / NIH/UT8656) TaxID=858893 RepID=H6C9W9_EXODN|nr:uncharacterized protein HMPREF1120_07949 [Exophiala dermatitidis NIH/UT8656]EHY59973.1 hypothetical protein HMPREF1120_07949 [Exophiala dermatitidis NIH/UT8656]